MEISPLSVTPAPTSPQEAPSQTTQATDETSPFTEFLSTAITANKTIQNNKKDDEQKTDLPSSPDQQDMSLAAALTALSFQDIVALTPDQQAPGQDLASTLASDTPAPVPVFLTPVDLKELQTMLTADGQKTQGLTQDDLKAFQAILETSGQNTSELTQETLKALKAIADAKEQTLSGLTPPVSEKQTAPSLNKTEALINQQLQAILTSASHDTLNIHTSYQAAPAESLNALTSPYLQTTDNSSETSLGPVQMGILEGTAKETKGADTVKSVRQNIAEQFLHAKFGELVDKNNTKNQQQENGPQDNNQNQQNTTIATQTTSLNTNEHAGQFNLAALGGVPVSAATTTNSPISHPAALPPGISVPAEELINHLVDRFSSNPRLQTSKVSLNLNPAELGALKIDILVKGDSIKAHIVASNLQIQDTIEKNMPKLRSVLEQQGFNIEDFQVTLEPTNPDANNFFQQQFSSRHDSMPQSTFSSNTDSFDLSLNSAEALLNATSDSGVNLSI